MVWACRKNGRVPYGQKGVDGGNKWRVALGHPFFPISGKIKLGESPGTYVSE